MKKLLFTLSLAWVMMQAPAIAQYDAAPDGITVRYTWTNYHYPIIKEDPFYNSYNEPGLEVGYVRNLNKFLNLAVPLRLGSANLPETETSFLDRQFVGNLDALMQLKYFNEPSWFSPYLFAGVGANYEFTRDHFNLQIPVGLGLNLRIAPHFYINAQTSYRVGPEDLRDN